MSTTQNSDLYTVVDDELYEELAQLVGQKIVRVELWEDGLADALSDENTAASAQSSFDLDLYLEDGVYFELYGVHCFASLESEPLQDLEQVERRLVEGVKQGVWLTDVAVDEDEALVLVLGRDQHPQVYLAVGGWLIDEWDDLPEGEQSGMI
jgi:hypothetical protein